MSFASLGEALGEVRLACPIGWVWQFAGLGCCEECLEVSSVDAQAGVACYALCCRESAAHARVLVVSLWCIGATSCVAAYQVLLAAFCEAAESVLRVHARMLDGVSVAQLVRRVGQGQVLTICCLLQ